MLSFIAVARYFVITTALVTLTGTLPVHLMLKRNYNYYNPEENIGSSLYLFEGDILIDRKRSVETQYFKAWLDRTVPYIFDSKFGAQEINLIEAAMQDLQNNSCIKFKRRTTESDYLRIVIPQIGCHSWVGRRGGPQDVSLGKGCIVHGIIQHEILHALGFSHEQSRRDRDKYIKVQWDNIREEHKDNFQIQTQAQSQEVILRLPYDYGSVMHYADDAFAIDHQRPTLVPLFPFPTGVVMGQRERFSQGDIEKLHALYNCDIQNCTDPAPLPMGYITGSDFSVGSKIKYSCQPGTVLVGAPERTCLDVGEWSGDNPACLVNTSAKPIYYCNFDERDKPLCSWTRGSDDQLIWQRHTGSTLSNGTGPYWDHTLSTAVGGYSYVEATNTAKGQKASLVSPRFSMSSRFRTCMAFFTYMYGDNMGNLTVYLKEEISPRSFSNAKPLKIFSLEGEQGRIWKQIFLVLGKMANPFYVTIEGTVGDGYKSDIAIDDVIVGDCSSLKPAATSGGLQENIQCSFDAGTTCGFLQDTTVTTDTIRWQIQTGRTPTLRTGPNCDPVNCSTGKYLYLETSRPAEAGNVARLFTPVLGGRGRCCLIFYYSMYGMHVGSLTIKLTNVNSGNVQVLWAKSGNQGKQWQVERVEYMAQEAYMVEFEGTVGSGIRGDIAIDSLSITTGRCSNVRRFDCNFEQDMCDWLNATSPTVTGEWIRHRGHTPSPETGPSGDRTSSNGYYIYVEASTFFQGDTARLKSPPVPYLQNAQCLTFWYHMYGSSIGNLTVYTQSYTGHEVALWTLSGNQGNQWISKSLNVTSFLGGSRDFYIIFEVVMAGFNSDVALDDISIDNVPCSS